MAFPYFSLTNEDPEDGSTFLPGLHLAQKLVSGPRTLLLETAFISNPTTILWSSLVAQLVKNLPAVRETWVRSLGWEDPLEKGKATHSSILARRIPQTVKSMGWQRVGHDCATFTLLSTILQMRILKV